LPVFAGKLHLVVGHAGQFISARGVDDLRLAMRVAGAKCEAEREHRSEDYYPSEDREGRAHDGLLFLGLDFQDGVENSVLRSVG